MRSNRDPSPVEIELVRAGTTPAGHPLTIPFHRLVGSERGPALGLVALLHGDETPGAEIVRRVLAAVDPGLLRGSIVAVPAAHLSAFEAGSRNSPVDALDLNRNFPGSPDGWATEQLAHVLSSRLFDEVEMIVDIHSADPFSVVDYVYLVEEARELGLALGCRLNFVAARPHPGGLLGAARSRGIPAVILELGGGRVAEEGFVSKGVHSILNVLVQYGMLPGERSRSPEPIVFHSLATIRPHSGGILHPRLGFERLGSRIAGEELLGEIVSPQTFEVLEELRSPFECGRALLLRTGIAKVSPGDFAYMISDVASEETRSA
jgi:predicted deacylase